MNREDKLALVHVRKLSDVENPNTPGYVVQVQEVDGSTYESPIFNEKQTETCVKTVVSAMLGFQPLKTALTIEATVLKKRLRNGIGLTEDHKQFVRVTNSTIEVLHDDLRWLTAQALMVWIGHRILDRSYLNGAV